MTAPVRIRLFEVASAHTGARMARGFTQPGERRDLGWISLPGRLFPGEHLERDGDLLHVTRVTWVVETGECIATAVYTSRSRESVITEERNS